MKAPKHEAWLFMSREAERLGAWEFADICLDRYFEECYRLGLRNTLTKSE